MRAEIQNFARRAVVLEQAETAGDFLVGFFFAAEIAAEAVLVELFAGRSCPTGGSRRG